MAGGAALAANGLDNALAGARTALTGQFHHMLTSQAAGAAAHALGASGKTTVNITNGVDIAQGLAGGGASIAAGIARKGAADMVKLSTAAHTLDDASTATKVFGSSPEGLAYRLDLPKHLSGPDGFRGGKLNGTHNQQTV